MTATRGFIYGAATTPLDTRKADGSKLAANADGTPRAGVIGPNPSIVISDASTAPMRIGILPAGFATQRANNDGIAHWTNDGLQFITVTKPGSQSWIVTVYAKHDDTAAGDADNLPVIGIVTGAAAAIPVEAAIPAGAMKLATVLIPSTATSTQSGGVVITNVYPMTAASGVPVPFRNLDDLLAWTAGVGQLATDLSTTFEYAMTSAGWRVGEATILGTGVGAMALLTSSYTDYGTVTARSAGGKVRLEWQAASRNANSGADRNMNYRLLCDGVVIDNPFDTQIPALLTSGGISNPARTDTMVATHTPAAGVHTWKLQAAANINTAVYVTRAMLTVTELPVGTV